MSSQDPAAGKAANKTGDNQNSTTNDTPRLVLDADQIRRSISRIAHEIIEKNSGAKNVAIVGIRTRGEHLARRIKDKIKEIEGVEIPFGVVDIALYRDDLWRTTDNPLVQATDLPFNVEKMVIILVDDVLYTGRTVRAGLDAIIDFGRPKAVQLAVLCDRGHRELPIRPDYVGKNIPTSRSDIVQVSLAESDGGEDAVYIKPRKSSAS
ncbi:bifunctional pyr operon transcriptional regulator/uracil phosphoribosyltransferase PyrR [bacterium]|nr:bifunctional pyr operon transcriptional regulator/uracil phosphoribosyltransferase PyrR [bacterium]